MNHRKLKNTTDIYYLGAFEVFEPSGVAESAVGLGCGELTVGWEPEGLLPKSFTQMVAGRLVLVGGLSC